MKVWNLKAWSKNKNQSWKLKNASLGVALVLESKAKDKIEEIKMDELSVMKFKSEVEIEEIKMDELSVMVKFGNWRNYQHYEAEGDKTKNEEIEYSENWICWCLKV